MGHCRRNSRPGIVPPHLLTTHHDHKFVPLLFSSTPSGAQTIPSSIVPGTRCCTGILMFMLTTLYIERHCTNTGQHDSSAAAAACRPASTDPHASRVSVLAFGADPLGHVDSTNAIQAALDSFGGRGGIVDVPSGRFRCDAQLVVPPSVTLIGACLFASRNSLMLLGSPTRVSMCCHPARRQYPARQQHPISHTEHAA